MISQCQSCWCRSDGGRQEQSSACLHADIVLSQGKACMLVSGDRNKWHGLASPNYPPMIQLSPACILTSYAGFDPKHTSRGIQRSEGTWPGYAGFPVMYMLLFRPSLCDGQPSTMLLSYRDSQMQINPSVFHLDFQFCFPSGMSRPSILFPWD